MNHVQVVGEEHLLFSLRSGDVIVYTTEHPVLHRKRFIQPKCHQPYEAAEKVEDKILLRIWDSPFMQQLSVFQEVLLFPGDLRCLQLRLSLDVIEILPEVFF